ncbi:MAG: DUF5655 domain-containing protein [Mycobacteriales bacterium]
MPKKAQSARSVMPEARDWNAMREQGARLLLQRTGRSEEDWNQRIAARAFSGPDDLAAWLQAEGVTGYARTHLIRERFGWPDFLTASADALIAGQYADRPALRPIFERLIAAALAVGDVSVQARKTYVSLVTPRRTFARIQATTRTRVDLALRLEGRAPQGRLVASKIHESCPLHISFTDPAEVDAEVLDCVRLAYNENS